MVNDDEIEIKSKEDYEIIPVTPLRRLEKRLESLETTKSMNSMEKFIDKVIDMVEMNQKIVDDMVRSNQSLREDLNVLIGKMDTLQSKIATFVDMVQSAAEGGEEDEEEDMEDKSAEILKTGLAESIRPIVDQIQIMNKQAQDTNTSLMQSMDNLDKRLKRMQAPSPAAPPMQYPSAREILARRGILPGGQSSESAGIKPQQQ